VKAFRQLVYQQEGKMYYEIKVTDEGILIPKNIPNGTYRLMIVDETESKECLEVKPEKPKGVELKRISSVVEFRKNGRRCHAFTEIIRVLRSEGYVYLSDLEGENVRDLEHLRGAGKGNISALIAVCEHYGISLIYDEKIFSERVNDWRERMICCDK
jgi:hypothetical protein